jgi:hypothetical protein
MPITKAQFQAMEAIAGIEDDYGWDLTVRDIARRRRDAFRKGGSVGATHEMLARLRAMGLVGKDNRLTDHGKTMVDR